MKYISFLLILLLAFTVIADEQQTSKAHLLAEAESKGALVERMRNAQDIELTKNQELYDAVFYHLDLFPDVTTETLYGDVSMTAVAREGGLDAVDLNLRDNMAVDSVYFNGDVVDFSHSNNAYCYFSNI